MKKTFLTLALLTLGCNEKADTPLEKKTARFDSNSTRFKVERVALFDDDLAYDGQRGVYLITDKETQKQYLGVSGIGISELGVHSTGQKNNPRKADER